ncbi:unnamed protein product, partial [Porites evermanni]
MALSFKFLCFSVFLYGNYIHCKKEDNLGNDHLQTKVKDGLKAGAAKSFDLVYRILSHHNCRNVQSPRGKDFRGRLKALSNRTSALEEEVEKIWEAVDVLRQQGVAVDEPNKSEEIHAAAASAHKVTGARTPTDEDPGVGAAQP